MSTDNPSPTPDGLRKAGQWLTTATLTVIAFGAFLLLCGEDTPGRPVGTAAFLATKGAALAALYVSVRLIAYVDRYKTRH